MDKSALILVAQVGKDFLKLSKIFLLVLKGFVASLGDVIELTDYFLEFLSARIHVLQQSWV